MSRAKERSTVFVVADSPEQAADELCREWAMEQRPGWVIDTGTPATNPAAVEADVPVARRTGRQCGWRACEPNTRRSRR